jgi:F-type H+-transporting ATPase subunit a
VTALARSWRALFALAVLCLLALPALASAAEDFDPSEEFRLEPYVSIELGPIDLSINKAVIYLLLATVITCGVGIFVVRGGLRLRPTRAQNIVELSYEFVENNIARQTLPPKMHQRYFPFLATLFLFIAVSNLMSFIPLPISHERGGWLDNLPDFGLYAATANINVTIALTIVVFIVYNYEGFKEHGFIGYFKTMSPEAPGLIKPIIFGLELLSQLIRLVSLSVRLFANLLAGHLLIIISAGFVILLGNLAGVLAIPFGVFFYFFEWVLIAGLQAFIFAMLSGIYIGFAVETQH